MRRSEPIARDPDVPTVLTIKETRGRRTKSLRIRDAAKTTEAVAEALKGAAKIVPILGEAGFLAFLMYSTRVVYVGYEGTLLIPTTVGTRSFNVIPTFRTRDVTQVDVTHPDAGNAELIGIILLLTNLPSGGLLEVQEDIGLIAVYHAVFNGFDWTLPLASGAPSLSTAVDIIMSFFGQIKPLIPLAAGTLTTESVDYGSRPLTNPPITPVKVSSPGLFRTSTLTFSNFASWVQAKRAIGQIPLPREDATAVRLPIDGELTRQFTVPKVLASLGHAGLLDFYMRRGLPTIGAGV